MVSDSSIKCEQNESVLEEIIFFSPICQILKAIIMIKIGHYWYFQNTFFMFHRVIVHAMG